MSIVKLITWAKSQSVNLKPKLETSLGVAYDDPNAVQPEDYRFDLGLSGPEKFNFDSNNEVVVEKVIPGSKYAVAKHRGSRENLAETTYPLDERAQSKGYEPGNFPCLFRYENFEHEAAETELKTGVMVLFKDTP